MFTQLCKDETPMVRRAAAQKLGGFAKAVEREHVSRELMLLFTDLIQDGGCAGRAAQAPAWARMRMHAPPCARHATHAPPACLPPAVQDSVRLLAVESCSSFAAALSPEDATAHLLPVIDKFAQVGGVCALAQCCRRAGLARCTAQAFDARVDSPR